MVLAYELELAVAMADGQSSLITAYSAVVPVNSLTPTTDRIDGHKTGCGSPTRR